MTSLRDLAALTRNHLDGDTRRTINTLAGSIDDVTAAVGLTFDTPVGVGGLLSIGDEDLYVVAYNSGTKTATCIRGYRGFAAAHTSGDQVEINARFSFRQIHEAMVAEINSWASDGLYYPYDVTLTVAAGASVVGLTVETAGAIGVINVLYSSNVVDDYFQPTAGSTTDVLYHELPHVSLVKGPVSGFGFPVLRLGKVFRTATTLSVNLAMPIEVDLDFPLAVNLLPYGLRDFMHEVVTLGAAARLLRPREAGRTSMRAFGQPRQAEEVPAGHIRSAGMDLWQQRNDAYKRALEQMRSLYPLSATG